MYNGVFWWFSVARAHWKSSIEENQEANLFKYIIILGNFLLNCSCFSNRLKMFVVNYSCFGSCPWSRDFTAGNRTANVFLKIWEPLHHPSSNSLGSFRTMNTSPRFKNGWTVQCPKGPLGVPEGNFNSPIENEKWTKLQGSRRVKFKKHRYSTIVRMIHVLIGHEVGLSDANKLGVWGLCPRKTYSKAFALEVVMFYVLRQAWNPSNILL